MLSLATGIETQTMEDALVFVGPNPTSSELNVYLYNSN